MCIFPNNLFGLQCLGNPLKFRNIGMFVSKTGDVVKHLEHPVDGDILHQFCVDRLLVRKQDRWRAEDPILPDPVFVGFAALPAPRQGRASRT